ncbi:MAG: ATP-binding protein [Planctomycetota bacterium]|jgi:signal transduction histidine kinase|nr:ATP-binding protein [Planctomycetota bacterium]
MHESPGQLRSYARLISLLRLLLLAIALAVLSFYLGGDDTVALWSDALRRCQQLLGGVAAAALLLVMAVPLVRHGWQLSLHLVFDLLWLGYVIYLSGGVASPGVPLLYAVVVTANLALPWRVPFLMPLAASLVLAGIATFYLGQVLPFDIDKLPAGHPLINPSRILGNLAVQVGALFLVDVLGQSLARRLHEERLLVGDLIEQIGEGVIAIDARGAVLYANESAATLLRLSASVEPGANSGEVLRDVDSAALAASLDAPVLPAETRLVTPDGRHLTLRAHTLRGRGGRALGRTLLIADETDLHRLEEESQRTERLAAMGEMAAGIAHEVRNPLASLRGCAQELGTIVENVGKEDASALCAIMVREADRVGRIVDDFLQLSRLRPPEVNAVALPALAAELELLVRRRDDCPDDLAFIVDIEDDCPPLAADGDHLRQVLSNLLVNAVEALVGQKAPQIELCAHGADNGAVVVLVVSDNGPGIPRDRLDQVFTPFHSTKSKGTGLGLTLVERMAREHGAHLHLSSAPGAGTQVELRWPAIPKLGGA